MASNRFTCDYARLGTASCKKCKQKLEKGTLRLAKLTANPFSEDAGDMKQWFHPACLFETFVKTRPNTKRIEDIDDVEDVDKLTATDKAKIEDLIKDMLDKRNQPTSVTKKTVQTKLVVNKLSPAPPPKPAAATANTSSTSNSSENNTPVKAIDNTSRPQAPVYLYHPDQESPSPAVLEKDNAFRTYRKLCAEVAEENSYTGKCNILKNFYEKGTSGSGFKGDLYLLVKLLLPQAVKRIYNLKDKQLIKLFSQIFHTDKDKMMSDLEKGDAPETVRIFFEDSKSSLKPSKSSRLSLQQVDDFLQRLSALSREEDQQKELTSIAKLCTANDLKMIIRLIKHDLRINAGAKYILEALDSNAYAAFQASRNLHDVLQRIATNWRASTSDSNSSSPVKPGMKKTVSVRASLLTPVLPMLAEACRSVDQALNRCPKGLYAEIKYDGERLQVHKQGDQFLYFSRSLKPVLPHKVQHLKDFIPKAFPSGDDLIIDSEILMVDTHTGKPLPFGTLGVHKKAAFKDACVCLFVFDCLHINGEDLMNKSMKHRRKVLEENMKEIKNHVMLSEQKFIDNGEDLREMMMEVFNEGLEGLVLKDINGVYEPGKRHWLKVKKDYLAGGSMADSADLIVLGAFFGTGNKGGMMSVFLMGCYDPNSKQFCTVTKVGNGHDDKTLDKLQTELKMIKISKDYAKVPSWLNVHKAHVPDFVVANPKEAPVWEISGAEFSQSDTHTAGGVSIRFPRVTKIRDDKTWKEATDVPRLKELFKISKERQDFVLTESSAKNHKKGGGNKRRRGASDDEKEQEEEKEGKKGKNWMKKQGKIGMEIEVEEKTEETTTEKKPTSKRPRLDAPRGSHSLTSLFGGLHFLIDQSIKQRDEAAHNKLYRYLVAYDADVLDVGQEERATHIVVPSDDDGKPLSSSSRNTNAAVKRVAAKWVWDCIKANRLLPLT